MDPPDGAVEVSGRSLADVFETAARALAKVTVDPATLPESIARHVALEAPTPDHLLFDWLSELIDLTERHGEVYPRTHVQVWGGGPCRLTARLYGGRIGRGRTDRRADVKGVALNEVTLEPNAGGWRARLVVHL